jgi:hypothetical protein
MGLKEKLKKRFLSDLVVLGVIIFGVLIYNRIVQQQVYWKIKRDKNIVGQNRTIEKQIWIQSNFEVEDSTFNFATNHFEDLGVILEGDSSLKMTDSTFESDDYSWFLKSYEKDGLSPNIKITNSELKNHSRVELRGNTEFEAVNSTLDQVILFDKATANLKSTSFSPYFFSLTKESFENLTIGEEVDGNIESNNGWNLQWEDSAINEYFINLVQDNDITVKESEGIVLNMLIEDFDNDLVIDIPTGQTTSGELQDFPFHFTWEKSNIKASIIEIQTGSKVDILNTYIRVLNIGNESVANLTNLQIGCYTCKINPGSTLKAQNVTVVKEPNKKFGQQILLIDDAKVVFKKSDLSDMQIKLDNGAELVLDDTQYDKNNIDKSKSSKIIDNE